MKIYTRTGDDGTTGLFGGTRVPKDDVRVEAYGAVDSTSSALGAALIDQLPEQSAATLRGVQLLLFSVGAELACAPGHEDKLGLELVSEAHAEALEREMDRIVDALPPLKRFILPGGSAGAAALHVARTTCRHAERRVVALAGAAAVRPELVKYLNRLGDLLFVMAREANQTAGVADVEWYPRQGS